METNPITPRQRNRRADRQQAESAGTILQPAQPVKVQRVEYGQAQQSPAGPRPASAPAPSQQLAAYYQQARPVSPQAQPRQEQPLQQRPAVQTQQPAPRPRSMAKPQAVDSGWRQPTLQDQADLQQVRGFEQQHRRSETPAPEETESRPEKKMPGWLSAALTLSFLGVLALVACYFLMQAYLVTEENKRIAAYEAVLNNYHLTESADGSLRVTWQEEIEHYAAQYNLQPAFVTAIIRNESSFRTNAESGVGARGLMQMMPDTAEWIAGKLNDSGYTFDSMWDGETNIRYGCWYLGYLSRLFNGDAALVSAAYHAGQTTVTQWLSDRTKSPDGIHLDVSRLSDGPTKQYIGRVTQTYGIYQTLLYPDAAFGGADTVSAAGGNAAAPGR